MRRETDLAAVKSLAKALLWLEPEETEFSPLVVKHPFTDSGIVGIRRDSGELNIGNIMESQDDLAAWRSTVCRRIEQSEAAIDIAYMITKPYALSFLKHAECYLSRNDLSQVLSMFWTETEAPNQDPNLSKRDLVRLFRESDPAVLMDTEEQEQLRDMEDTVTVYRGVPSDRPGNVKALSWTLNKETADWFAHRYGRDGRVYQAQISKDHILAVFNGRNEAEVVVEPNYLQNVTPEPTMQHTQEMKL